MELQQRIAAARGAEPADLLLTNLQLVNVHTGEIYRTEIAIADEWIVGVGKGYDAREVIDLGGRYVAPGLIDAHVHIESSLCTPPEFAKAVLVRGITSVITDPHEIANVLGLEGIRFMLNAAKYNPLSMYVMASSCVPATHMETSGAALEAEDLSVLLNNKWVLGLAEMMNYPGVVAGNSRVLQKIEMFRNKVLDGHCPGLTGKALNAYCTAGISSDHECTTVEEAREKLRAGMHLFIREATNARNLHTLLPVVTPENSRRICFCTDDRQPADLLEQGSVDYMVRVAIEHGVNPIDVLRMATLNTAEYFRLHEHGAVAPGYRADLMIFSDLKAPSAEIVFRSGKRVAENGKLTATFTSTLSTMRSSINVHWNGLNFDIPAQAGAKIRVIGSVEGNLVTEHRIEEPALQNGMAVVDIERDILKMAVIERHTANGNMGKGFIQGIGLKRGAIAGTVAHDHHNLVVIGADDASMMTAARAVASMDGGLVAVDGETILAKLPLPIAGLMSDRPVEEVSAAMENLLNAAHELGSPMHDPFMAMSFMALEVIPNLKLTDIGLVDVEKFEPVSLFI